MKSYPKWLLKIVLLLVFTPAIILTTILPTDEVARELIGFSAYIFPIAATLIAGEAIIEEKYNSTTNDQPNHSSTPNNHNSTRAAFIRSLALYLFGSILYAFYISWPHLKKHEYNLKITSFTLIILMSISSFIMYKNFKIDNKNSFIRPLLGSFFAMASILLFILLCLQ